MSWHADLSPFPYFPDGSEDEGRLLAVGWLAPGQPYATGELRDDVVERLLTLLINPWQPLAPEGTHNCRFCRISGGPKSFGHVSTLPVRLGHLNLFLPGAGKLYIAPSLIVHYVDAHGYWPPDEFCAAVLACPEMRSPEYLRAVVANGGRRLIPRSKAT